jgi:hypothetical protein
MGSDFAKQFSGCRYINLESYKSNGAPELTPVQSIEHEGLLYMRTDPRSEKVKRIRENPKVRIVPCGRSGNPTGVWVGGEAKVLEGEEYEEATKLLKEKPRTLGNLLVNLVAWLRRQRLTAIISIRPQLW